VGPSPVLVGPDPHEADEMRRALLPAGFVVVGVAVVPEST